MRTQITAMSISFIALLGPSAGACGAAEGATPAATAATELDLPGEDEIAEHRTYDRGPELQRTPGGSLIVDAFIMEGPVRVAIHNRESGELLLEKESRSLFAFEVARSDMDAEPEDVVVRIYVEGELAHELTLNP